MTLAPSAEQLAVTRRVAKSLARALPQGTGVMDYEDVQQMAAEALLLLMTKGPLPKDEQHLGRLVKSRTIDLLRVQGVLSRVKDEENGGKKYVRHERPTEMQSVSSLNPQSMEVLRLSFEEDMTPKQIGVRLGRTMGSVNVVKSRSLRALRGALTARELEVLVQCARGHTNIQTAKKLGISEHTVKTHVKGVNRALGAKNTAHAVAIGFKQGLLK